MTYSSRSVRYLAVVATVMLSTSALGQNNTAAPATPAPSFRLVDPPVDPGQPTAAQPQPQQQPPSQPTPPASAPAAPTAVAPLQAPATATPPQPVQTPAPSSPVTPAVTNPTAPSTVPAAAPTPTGGLLEEPAAPVETPEATAPALPTGPTEVDLAALYYYAEQKQEDRVAAEAARLRLKYPDFVMPSDLYLPREARAFNDTILWKMYETNDFAGIDAEIARRKAIAPQWNPSADFSMKFIQKKQRVLMTEATRVQNWPGVIDAAKDIDPKTETQADLLWMMIDAYANMGDKTGLSAVYRGILFRDGDKRLPDAILVTTLQKATRDFPPADVRAAIAKIATTPAMTFALQSVTTDMARGDISNFNASTDTTPQTPLPDDDIQRLKAAATAQGKPADLALLGWYYYKLNQPAVSAEWFRKALAVNDSVDNAKGLYLSLAGQNLNDEAYQVAASHLKALSDDPIFLLNALSPQFSKPQIEAIDPAIIAAYSKSIMDAKSADHAEILGWYAYNSKQFQASQAWFDKAFAWKQSADRLKGLALSFMRQNNKSGLADLRDQYGSLYPDMWTEIKAGPPPSRRRPAAQPAITTVPLPG